MNLKNRAIPVLLVVAVALSAGTAMAQFKGDVNLWYGMKEFGDDYKIEDDFDTGKQPSSIGIDLTSQQEYGIMSNFGSVNWPVAIAFDVLSASDDGTWSYTYEGYAYDYTYSQKLDTSTMEINVGVRKFFLPDGKFQPYIGGGFDYIKADADITLRFYETPNGTPAKQLDESFTASDSSSTVGFFLNGGVVWRLGKMVNLGLDLRYSDGSVDFEFDDDLPVKQSTSTESVDVGGYHYGLFVGIRF